MLNLTPSFLVGLFLAEVFGSCVQLGLNFRRNLFAGLFDQLYSRVSLALLGYHLGGKSFEDLQPFLRDCSHLRRRLNSIWVVESPILEHPHWFASAHLHFDRHRHHLLNQAESPSHSAAASLHSLGCDSPRRPWNSRSASNSRNGPSDCLIGPIGAALPIIPHLTSQNGGFRRHFVLMLQRVKHEMLPKRRIKLKVHFL